MTQATVPLPTDANGNRVLGTLDNSTNLFSILRARFTQSVPVNGSSTLLGDLGTVAVGDDGTMAVVLPSATLVQGLTLPVRAGTGLRLTAGPLLLQKSVAGTYDIAMEASTTGTTPGSMGILATAPTVWDTTSATYRQAQNAASLTTDTDPGTSLPVTALRAWNGSTYGRLQISAKNHAQTTHAPGTKSAPNAVSVGTTATILLAANTGRIEAKLANNSAATVYVGRDATVTVANGYPIAANSSMLDQSSADPWYGIVASGTADVRVLEIAE